jgi:choline dehydrogenase-like flavoprotein
MTNLYMAGSSCFPTSGAANPTLSLLALTFRLSDHLKKRAMRDFGDQNDFV